MLQQKTNLTKAQVGAIEDQRAQNKVKQMQEVMASDAFKTLPVEIQDKYREKYFAAVGIML